MRNSEFQKTSAVSQRERPYGTPIDVTALVGCSASSSRDTHKRSTVCYANNVIEIRSDAFKLLVQTPGDVPPFVAVRVVQLLQNRLLEAFLPRPVNDGDSTSGLDPLRPDQCSAGRGLVRRVSGLPMRGGRGGARRSRKEWSRDGDPR